MMHGTVSNYREWGRLHMSRRQLLKRLIPLFGLMSLLLTGCGDPTMSALDPHGPVAKKQLWLMELSLVIMILVFIVVMAIYIYVLIKFRRRKGDNSIPKQVEGNHILEILWTVIPIILLVILCVPTVMATFQFAKNYDKDKNAIHVKVTAHQFWWEFTYKDYNIDTAEDLVVPVGKKIAVDVVSADVNHAFWIPNLAGKIDANAGIVNHMYFQADEPNVYQGKCAELCGASHALMDFKVKAVSQSDFDKWVKAMKAPQAKPSPNNNAAVNGETIFKQNCMTCHGVDPTQVSSAAPNLNNFANREKIAGILQHTDANLEKWISDPQAVKPGAKMPAWKSKLTTQQIKDVVAYLDTLKK